MRGRSKLWSFAFSGLSVLAFFVACDGGSARPLDTATASSGDGGNIFEATVRDALEDTGDSGTCLTKAKDGTETDVDCGGSSNCPRCELGKGCNAKADCAGGASCVNKLCALCEDKQTNGDESDIDCGGKACGACTVGKRCATNADCRSGACLNQACACPKGMAIIALAAGGAYCVDQAEVTKGEYDKFITASVPFSSQTAECAGNDKWIPRGAWPLSNDPGPPTFNFGIPVHYVDWCDAAAYCKWAKKQLCRSIEGDAPVAGSQGAVATKSAWYNACSAQGVLDYPYGDNFDSTKCNTDGVGVPGPGALRGTGFGYALNGDQGIYDVGVSDATGTVTAPAHISCQGGSTGLYQMSGNVAEWEDSCDGNSPDSNCRVRGGSYASATTADQSCAAVRDVVRMPPAGSPEVLRDIGFRCCQY